jgi:hypothetical protein
MRREVFFRQVAGQMVGVVGKRGIAPAGGRGRGRRPLGPVQRRELPLDFFQRFQGMTQAADPAHLGRNRLQFFDQTQ